MLKDNIKQMIEDLPEDCSLEDIQYALYVREKVERSMKDVEEDNLISHEEVEATTEKWLRT